MLTNYFTSLIRTGSALLVGWLLSLPLAHPVLVALGKTDLTPAAKEKLVGGLVAVLTALYYATAHAAEKRWPQATWLLGSSKQPASYVVQDGHTGVLPPDLELNPQSPDYSKVADGAVGKADASQLTKPIPVVGIDSTNQEFGVPTYHVAEHAAEEPRV